MHQDINNNQLGTSVSRRDTVRKTIKTIEMGRTGTAIHWKREYGEKQNLTLGQRKA